MNSIKYSCMMCIDNTMAQYNNSLIPIYKHKNMLPTWLRNSVIVISTIDYIIFDFTK